MAIEALALLRISNLEQSARVKPLADCVIVHTGKSFATEPEELVEALATALGEAALAQHDDSRGILFMPDVAAPKALAYDAIVDEVGEGGVWGQREEAGAHAMFGGDFGALLGSVLGQLPPSLLAAASSAAQGDSKALDSVSAQMQALLGSSPALQDLAGQLSGMLGQSAAAPQQPVASPSELASLQDMFARFGGGEDAQSSLRELAGHMQSELANDPAKFEQLAKQLLGDAQTDDEIEPKK